MEDENIFFSEGINSRALMTLGTMHIIENTLNLETLLQRFDHLETIVEELREFKKNPSYNNDIQAGIDNFKLLHFDKVPSKIGLLILAQPEVDSFNELFCVNMFNALGRQFEKHIEEYKTLKLEKAKSERKRKMLVNLDFARENILLEKKTLPIQQRF